MSNEKKTPAPSEKRAQGELSDESLEKVSGGIVSSFNIDLSEEAINAARAAAEEPMQGEAASSFCLAGDTAADGSLNCVDEEVAVTNGGTIRGRPGSR